MSGGSYSYIQNKDADEILENSELIEEIGRVAHFLSNYGTVAMPAQEATRVAQEQAVRIREKLRTLRNEFTALIEPLQKVWRQVDYRGSMDISDADVIDELERYNLVNGAVQTFSMVSDRIIQIQQEVYSASEGHPSMAIDQWENELNQLRQAAYKLAPSHMEARQVLDRITDITCRLIRDSQK